jgi:hypothetical protein
MRSEHDTRRVSTQKNCREYHGVGLTANVILIEDVHERKRPIVDRKTLDADVVGIEDSVAVAVDL